MAEFNLIQKPELIQRLIHRLGVVGQKSIAPTLSETVVPVVIVEDLIERHFVDEPRTYGGAAQGLGTLVGNPFCRLSNPAGSGVVARVTRLFVQHGRGALDNAFLAIVDPTTATMVAGHVITFAINGRSFFSSPNVVGFGSTASKCLAQGGDGNLDDQIDVTPIMFWDRMILGATVVIDLPRSGIVLQPNRALEFMVGQPGATEAVGCSWQWEEHPEALLAIQRA